MKNYNFKYKVLALYLMLGLLTSVNAQQANSITTFKVGIKAGANLSNLYSKNVNSENALLGFNAGFFVKLPVTQFFAIQPELYYTRKGAKNEYNNVFATGNVKYTFDYIELPILAVINISKNFNVQAGPYVGYLLSGKVINESNVSLFDFERNISTDDYNKLDAGLIGGIGVDFSMISFMLRYNYGLTRVGKDKNYGGANYVFPDGKNSVLSLNIAISFN